MATGENKHTYDVKAIGVSGQQHGFVALDKKNKSIRPAKLWCDTSTVDQCKQFEEKFGGPEGLTERIFNQIGISATKTWLSVPKQIAEKSIRRSRWRRPQGRELGSSIGG